MASRWKVRWGHNLWWTKAVFFVTMTELNLLFFRKSSTAKTDHGFITTTWQPNCREFSGTVQLGEFLCPLNSGKNWITIPSLMSNSNFVSFHSQAWESTYTKWQKLTFDLVNFGKDDSPSIDVQKYLRRRSHAKITTDNLQVHLYTFNFLATIRDQDRIYPFNINTISSRLLVVILKNIKGLLIDPIPNSLNQLY